MKSDGVGVTHGGSRWVSDAARVSVIQGPIVCFWRLLRGCDETLWCVHNISTTNRYTVYALCTKCLELPNGTVVSRQKPVAGVGEVVIVRLRHL